MHTKTLQDYFHELHHNSHMKKKEDEEFIQFLREIANLEESYAKGLEKLGNNPYNLKEGELSKAISSLKAELLYKAKQARSFGEKINEELAEPFKMLLRSQSLAIKKTHIKSMKVEKTQEMILEKNKNAKKGYWKSCNECEQLTLSLEQSKSQGKTEKLIQKLLASKKEVDISLKGYLDTLEELEKSKKKHKSLITMLVDTYKKYEEKRLVTLKECLCKLFNFEAEYLSNMLDENHSAKDKIENISIQAELSKFDAETQPNSLLDLTVIFEPYEGVHPSFKNLASSPIISLPHNNDQK